MITKILFLLTLSFCGINFAVCSEVKLLLVSIATEKTDGFIRFEQSVKAYNYDYEIFGMGEEWRGGYLKLFAGGGQKINILKKNMLKYRDDENLVVLITDSYDVIVNQSPEEVLRKFKTFDSRVLFSSEDVCWPHEDLADEYPEVGENEKRFLNSGGIIGYANDLYELIMFKEILDDDDDQLYFTQIFLDESLRSKYNLKLDTFSEIFQNLNNAAGEISLVTSEDNIIIYNEVTKKHPAIIHGNGPSKIDLNRIGNYIGKAFSSTGCKICHNDILELKTGEEGTWPNVTIGVFIEQATPFLKEFFQKISALNYPKSKITMLIYNGIEYHNKVIEEFFVEPENEYFQIKYISPSDEYSEPEARTEAMAFAVSTKVKTFTNYHLKSETQTEAIRECVKSNCDFYFSISSSVHLDNPNTLKTLIEQNRGVLSPIMTVKDTLWSNVWGAIRPDGYYERSDDYMDIVNRKNLGVWNLPYVSQVVLTRKDVLKNIGVIYEKEYFDSSMVFAEILREKDIFMFGSNMEYFGHLIDSDNYDKSLIRPEMFEIMTNFEDWKARYLNKEYAAFLTNSSKALEPCHDVFWFPVVNDEFCEDLITMMEDFGDWSGGRSNYSDKRLPGGVENVPTVDIHMKQIGWDEHWLFFLKHVIMPMQQAIFPGYHNDPPQALLSFVVRYRPGEQDHLVPHNDASTYTINIALNKPDVDFEGGGCRFVRRNCSVTKTKKGWAMIHPGRLTHLHEGLKTTKGTRYIMVTFVDP